MFTRDQKATLLRIAREAIAGELRGAGPAMDPTRYDDALRRPAGAFVTLRTRDGNLRGCIGSIHPSEPLCQAVATSAVNAAFRDPRFPPLRSTEMEAVVLEVSVLGPVIPVSDIEEIVCGRDGLVVLCGAAAGLLLPQVAAEQRWDRPTFLSQTCLKAGLDPFAWWSGVTKISRFETCVFNE